MNTISKHRRTNIKQALKLGKAKLHLVGSSKTGFRLAGSNSTGVIIPIGQTFKTATAASKVGQRKYRQDAVKVKATAVRMAA